MSQKKLGKEKFISWFCGRGKKVLALIILYVIIVLVFGYTIYVEVGSLLCAGLWCLGGVFYGKGEKAKYYLAAALFYSIATNSMTRYIMR